MASKRTHGFGLIDALVAGSALLLATAGAFAGWSVMLRHNLASHLTGLAAQLARGEIERAKVYGADGLPLGVYSAASDSAVWGGAYDSTINSGAGGWVSSATTYYDAGGNQVASATGASLAVRDAITDTNVLATAGGGYVLQPTSQREIVVTVNLVSDDSTALRMGTILVQGGL